MTLYVHFLLAYLGATKAWAPAAQAATMATDFMMTVGYGETEGYDAE